MDHSEWQVLPSKLSALSPDQRRDFSLQLLAYLLYPPGEKSKDHNSRQRQRMVMLNIISELAEIEREFGDSTPDIEGRCKDLLIKFMSGKGFALTINSSPARRYKTTRLRDQWIKICSAFACFDVIHRAAVVDGVVRTRSETGINQARWLVLLNASEFPFLVGKNMQQLGEAAREYRMAPHILLALLRIIPPSKAAPSLDDLCDLLAERLESFLALALPLQEFFQKLHVVRHGKRPAKRKIVLLPGFDGLPEQPEPLPLSKDELMLLRRYENLELKELNSSTANQARRNILENKPIDWSADKATSRKN